MIIVCYSFSSLRMKAANVILLNFFIAIICVAQEPKHNYIPKDGCVPTAEVAIKIAVAVWEPIYGADKIAGEKPFRATLTGDVWTVESSMPKQFNLGGVAVAEISKTDGRVIRISHGM